MIGIMPMVVQGFYGAAIPMGKNTSDETLGEGMWGPHPGTRIPEFLLKWYMGLRS